MAISKIQLPDNSQQDIHDARISDISSTYPKFYVGTCPTAAATAAKVVTTETFPTVNGAPVTGTVIAVKFSNTNSATAPTLNVNGLGAESIYYNAAVITSTSANYGGTAGRYIYYMWDGTYWCWLNHGVDSDTNTTAYLVRYQYASKPLAGHLARYRLLFTSADGTKWVPSNTGTSTNATSSRTVNQTPIDPFGPIVYYGSTTIKETDEIAAASSLYTQRDITFGYSFNVTNAELTLTVNAPVYIKCAPQSNGSAIIDSTTPYVQSLPSTADGKIYIYLGQAYGATTVELSIAHPVYYYADGQIRLWTNAASGGGEANVIEGITFNGTAVTVTNKVAAIYGADTELAPAGGADLVRAAGLSDYVNSTTFALPNSDADGYCDYTLATTADIPVGVDNDDFQIIHLGYGGFDDANGNIYAIGNGAYDAGGSEYTDIILTRDSAVDYNFIPQSYTAISSASSSTTLAWRTMYQWTVNPTSITLTLPSAPTDPRGEIVLKFTTGSTAPTVTWPSGLKWANGEEVTIEASTVYEFSIGYDMVGGWTIVGCGFTAAS